MSNRKYRAAATTEPHSFLNCETFWRTWEEEVRSCGSIWHKQLSSTWERDWQPSSCRKLMSGRRLCISSAFKFILHHASKLLDHRFLKSSEGLCRCRNPAHPRDRNQSINPPTGQRSRAARTHWTSRPRLEPITVRKKHPDILSIPQSSASSLQLSQACWSWNTPARRHDRRSYRSGCERRAAWIITHRRELVECANRPTSVGFPYQRQIDEGAERWLSVSFEANGSWNINLLKGLAADTLDCANLLWVSLTGQSVKASLCVCNSVRLKIQIVTLIPDNRIKSLFGSQFITCHWAKMNNIFRHPL